MSNDAVKRKAVPKRGRAREISEPMPITAEFSFGIVQNGGNDTEPESLLQHYLRDRDANA